MEATDEQTTPYEGLSTYQKALSQREPVFVLRAQDLTADVFVKLWAFGQLYVHQRIAQGVEKKTAVLELEAKLVGPILPITTEGLLDMAMIGQNSKVSKALMIADDMLLYPNRKLAD